MTEHSPSEGMTENSPSEGMTDDAVVGESLDLCNVEARNVRRKRLKMHRTAKPLPLSDKLLLLSETTSSSSSSLSSSPDSLSFSPESSPEIEGKGGGVDEEVTCWSHGVASVMGRRREMEDTVRAQPGFFVSSGCEISKTRKKKKKKRSKLDYFAVFDGHGGGSVAALCRNRMHRILEDEIQAEMSEGNNNDKDIREVDWEKVMLSGFEKMDEEVVGCCGASADGLTVGSTAVVAVVGAKEVVVANCGDSRAVICRNGVAFPLSDDHKPGRPDELARIEAAGGKVINWNGNRVLGVLATSRSIGDNYLKPYVISTPEVTVSRRTEEDEFLILASDGLWDVVSNELACQVTRRCLDGRLTLRRRGEEETVVASATASAPSSFSSAVEKDENDRRASDAASLLVQLALARGSRDNISVVVAQLNRPLKQARSSST